MVISVENEDYIYSIQKKMKRGAKSKYPFEKINVSESFVFGDDVKGHSMRCIASRKGKELEKVFFVDLDKRKVVRIK